MGELHTLASMVRMCYELSLTINDRYVYSYAQDRLQFIVMSSSHFIATSQWNFLTFPRGEDNTSPPKTLA